ncbi:MAG: translation elongation factor Ts, partial [Halofilum sp. (in: g-proteobacteria)]
TVSLEHTGGIKALEDFKAGRVAAEGVILARVSDDGRTGVLVEINSETDFVAKNEEFQGFADRVARRVLEDSPADVDALSAMSLGDGDDRDVATATKELVAKIGENIEVRRFERHVAEHGRIATYLHGQRIGVLVEYSGDDEQVGRDVAMHVAASQPIALNADEVPSDQLEKEREFLEEQARDSGKPEEIVKKMVEGRIRKHLGEITLMGQPFVKDPDQSVEDMLKSKSADAHFFRRFEVGEGKEKKEENFAEEVRAQVEGG